MAVRRFSVLSAVITLTLLGLTIVPAPAGADGVLNVSATSVPVGGTFSVSATGCDQWVEGPDNYSSQNARLSLLSGSGAGERAIAIGIDQAGGPVTIPGWVDPDEPARLVGTCVETRFDFNTGASEEVVLYDYPQVAIDILPAESDDVRTVTLTLDRDTAAGGQVVRAQVSGCREGDYAGVSVSSDTDLTLGGSPRSVLGAEVRVSGSGPQTIELALSRAYRDPGPLADGDYVVVAVCYSVEGEEYRTHFAQPTWLYVRGTVDVGAMTVEFDAAADRLLVSGDGCAGRTVTARLSGYVMDTYEEIDEALPVTQADDGTWTATWTTTAIGFSAQVDADCGDPSVDGYRYRRASWYEDAYSEQWVGRTSPTASPVGGPIDVHVSGNCDDERNVVQILATDGQVLSEGVVHPGALTMAGRATVTAPGEAGTYRVVASCEGKMSYPRTIEVFAPTPVAPRGSLNPMRGATWPETGEREAFSGRIGPITLPAGHDHGAGTMAIDGEAVAAPAGLGPSGLGVAVPRPSGDFAITRMTFDLVDENGRPVGASDAHLHHLVIADLSSSNPACPTGTFGLPGEIVAAAGAERTALDFGDPYGLVVEDSDPWAGVYEVMNMVDEQQTVYLTYDMEIRRDLENVRPVSTYFGSATGCGSFTWTIDGSGNPDRQGHYLTMANDGVLVGAGGHLHNGGVQTDLYNDRGRLVCRNELVRGGPGEHEHPDTTTTTTHDHGAVARGAVTSATEPADDETTSTTAIEEWPQSPPEMYPDDPPLESITGCQPNERVTAGERLYFEATYLNDRARSGVMGIFMLYVWEGGGPVQPIGLPGLTSPGPGGTPTTHDHGSVGTPTTHDHGSVGTPTTHDHGSGGTPTTHDHGSGGTPTTHDHGSGPTSTDHGSHGSGGVGVAGESVHVHPARPAAAYRAAATYAG